MKYSVLMSVYKNDNPAFLKLALDSIYDSQTKKPDEIVIVYDGPISSELESVIQSFRIGKEKMVKCYPQKENKGLGEALRIGTNFCTGDYIFRMDSDDISAPDRFEIQSKYVESHPDVDVVGGDFAEFQKTNSEKRMRIRSCPKEHSDIVKMGKKRNPMNHVTVCIKKSSLIKAGGYLALRYVEDYYLWVRMINSGFKLANIDKTLVYVRIGNGFTSRRSSKEQIRGWQTIQDYMVKNKMVTKKQAKKNMLYIRCFVKTPTWVKKLIYSLFLRK